MIHLAGKNYKSREIVQNMFSPLVGVSSSTLADDICHRNNLSFVELLQPFSKLPNEAQFRDVSGVGVSIRGLRLNICDVDWRPSQTVLARKMLSEAVTNAKNDKTKFVHIGNMELELPTAEPWFEQWRETFLTVQFPADHEFTRHFLSCLIVLSSNDPNVLDTANKLTQRVQQMQNMTREKLPKWFYPSEVLNSYVMLHEGSSGDLSNAQQSYELLKSSFGDSKCFLIQINSLDANCSAFEVPDYWAPYIKRQPKNETLSEQFSAPKTPQETISVMTMPIMQMSTLSNTSNSENELAIVHPLSPTGKENTADALLSISSESLVSQNINTNAWTGELEVDASHGGCLNAMDVENLRHFLQDYVMRALIPYVEHLVMMLNEAITNKKGVSKSLLSATKRWFVTSKPGVNASNQNAVIYTHESTELQTRKLGDLYFMFGHYNLAFQAYHQAKRDFNADSAWQYYAGALEMAAISAFMLGTANRKTYDYMENAIVTYLMVCKLQQFATRATLLSVEVLKTARLYGEAAKQLIRMTSEESDLRSALLLEQAAYCFLALQPAMYRKYAFHIVLSGHRYSRVAQRKHAYRCYRQAYQVLQERGWTLAEDHIQYTLAKQAFTLKKLEEASSSFGYLLRFDSLQSEKQQLNFLREYIQTQHQLIKRNPELGLLPHALPKVLQHSIRVLVSAHPPAVHANFMPATNIDIRSSLAHEQSWHKLEEMIVGTIAANKAFFFKPTQCLFTKDNASSEFPIAVQGERIELCVTLQNTLRCSITLTDIDLLWKLKLDNDEVLSNICLYEQIEHGSSKAALSAAIKTICQQTLLLGEHEEQTIYFSLSCKLTGHLTLIGLVAQVAASHEATNSVLGSLTFEAQRIRFATSNKQSNLSGSSSQQTLFDNKLNIKIVPSVPSLGVSFSVLPTELLAGEILPVTITLRNSGIVPIEELYLGCEQPRWITLQDKDSDLPLAMLSTLRDLSNEKFVKDKEVRRQHVFHLLKQHKPDCNALQAQESVNIPMWLQAPYQSGLVTMRLLFYYGLPGSVSTHIKYRLVRHSWQFRVHECLRTHAACIVSNPIAQELGLQLIAKNDQPEMCTELYLNSLALYCANFKLNPHKLHITNRIEVSVGECGDACLKAGKSASFQCRLVDIGTAEDAKTALKVTNMDAAAKKQLINLQLSSMCLLPATHVKKEVQHVPALTEPYSFLMKHETVYFSPTVSAEEFNSIVARTDAHATVVLSWSALVQQRLAFGQHFMTLRHLYERVFCPDSNSLLSYMLPTGTQICSYTALAENENSALSKKYTNDDDQQQDYWEQHDYFMGKRCLLEDDSVMVVLKV